MKRVIALFLSAIMIFGVSACGSNTESEKSSDDSYIAEVDEGLLNVEITMPAHFFTDTTEEDIKVAAEENGFKDCTINEDGSVTYKMSKSKHKEMLNDLKSSFDESIASLLEGESAVESFKDITYNENFSKIDVLIDRNLYSDWDNISFLLFYISGAYYQAFDGVKDEDIDIVIDLIDVETNEVFDTASYKEWIKNMEE